jgi:hypothetical protein
MKQQWIKIYVKDMSMCSIKRQCKTCIETCVEHVYESEKVYMFITLPSTDLTALGE